MSRIYFHDSADMHEIESSSAHLIVTSPPYPMIAKWDSLFGTVDFKEQHHKLNSVWKECYRILVDGGIACINIGDATRTINKNFCCYPNFAKVTMDMMHLGFVPLIPILWKKISNRPNAFLGSGMIPPNGYISQDCEYIAIFRKGSLRKFPAKDENRYNSSFTFEERNQWFQQIWEINGDRGASKTSAFPEEIPYRLIRMFSCIGDTVVDPFTGTGTTMRVCDSLDRNFVGYELPNEKGELIE